MIVIVAGSRALPKGTQIGRWLIELLGKLPPDTTVLLRQGKFKEPGDFETMTAMICDVMGISVEWRRVEIDIEQGLVGRKAVFARDLQMAADCDVAFCFTMPDQSFDMECGTTALAQKVLEADKAVYHWALFDTFIGVEPAHALYRVGEHDPGQKFARYLPA